LDKNRVLEELNLEDNELGDKGAHSILEGLKVRLGDFETKIIV
jgi:hypothetical protein